MARFGSVISSIGDLNKDQFNGEYIYIRPLCINVD